MVPWLRGGRINTRNSGVTVTSTGRSKQRAGWLAFFFFFNKKKKKTTTNLSVYRTGKDFCSQYTDFPEGLTKTAATKLKDTCSLEGKL